MPVPLAEIVLELDGLLQPERFQDYCPNGLQVPGAELVSTLATGVSANLELFERARAEGAELILAHHGLFWGSSAPGPIDVALKRRLEILFEANMSLLAYHLPLDAHLEVGNNALLARAIGAEKLEPFALHAGRPIGVLAHFHAAEDLHEKSLEEGLPVESPPATHPPATHPPATHPPATRPSAQGPPAEGLPAPELFARIQQVTAREPLVFDAGPACVRRLAIVTGAGANYLADAIAAGADAFLTGEPAERVMSHAREAHMHFIAAGHYATETFGVKRLGEHLSEHFGLRHVFIDVPNPI